MSLHEDYFKRLEEHEAILMRPASCIGTTKWTNRKDFIFDLNANKMVCKEINACDGLERIFLEILSNAGDNIQRSREEGVDPGIISVIIKNGTISIYNEGLGFPTGVHPDYGVRIPEAAFSELHFGSNLSDDRNRSGSGSFGVGATVTNLFSKKFIVKISDPKRKVVYRQVFENNKSKTHKFTETPYNGKKATVSVQYNADFVRFNKPKDYIYDEDTIGLFARHIMDLSFFNSIPVILNGKRYDFSEIRNYGKLYTDGKLITYEDKQNRLIIFDTLPSNFILSYVNGMVTRNHGKHVDKWVLKLKNYIDNLPKFEKYKIRLQDIRDTCSIIVSARVNNPEFIGLTKDRLGDPTPIIEEKTNKMFKISTWNMLKNLLNIKKRTKSLNIKTDGKKTKFINSKLTDKLKGAKFAGTSKSYKCVLMLTEGDSAKELALKGIGEKEKDYFGAFPLRGKFINTSKSKVEKLEKNNEFLALKQILGLKEGKDYSIEKEYKTLRYGGVRLMSDQDNDGFHINALIINMFRDRYPSLLKRGYVQIMLTPIIRCLKGKQCKKFYHLEDYEKWSAKIQDQSVGWKIEYYKGLAQTSDKDICEEFKKPTILKLEFDGDSEMYLSNAFDNGKAQERRMWILNKLNGKLPTHKKGCISYYMNRYFIGYSIADVRRSLPSKFDGLKRSQRQVLYGCMKKKNTLLKVTQLSGFVSDITHYHHGEDSLHNTIIKMAQKHIGSNNIPILYGKGQFGTREGGKPPQPRYVKVHLGKLTEYIFLPEDNVILEYRNEDGYKVEPKCYYPIIPIHMANGCVGIGTGNSIDLPSYNPITIIDWILNWILKYKGGDYEFPELSPYYNNYKGKINKKTINKVKKWVSYGEFEMGDDVDEVIITELPATTTIDQYKKKLNKMMLNGSIKQWKDISYANKEKSDIIPQIIITGIKNPTIKKLGLQSTISESNISVLDEQERVVQFTLLEMIDDFCKTRLAKYVERKNKIIDVMETDIKILLLKKAFLEEVSNEKFKIQGKEPNILQEEMRKKGYPLDFLKSSLASITVSKLKNLGNKIKDTQDRLTEYKEKEPIDIWVNDLNFLKSKISTVKL